MSNVLPVVREEVRGEPITQKDIDSGTDREREKGTEARARQLPKTGRQSDAQEAEDECPGPKVLERGDQTWYDLLVVVREAVPGGHRRQQNRRHKKSKHELREAPPDLPRIGARTGLTALPVRRCNDGQDESPDADPDVTAHHLHQREGKGGLIRGSGDPRNRASHAPVGLRGRKPRGICELGRADPGSRYAGRQLEGSRDERQHKDHDDRPEDDRRDGNRRILLACADGSGDGDSGGDSAHRATCTQDG